MGNGIKKRIIVLLLVVTLLFSIFIPYTVLATPTISIVEPPVMYNTTLNTFAVVNVSVSDGTKQVSTFIDWDKSLIGYWNFEDITATGVNDSSTHNNFVTYGGGLLESNNNSTGKFGTSMIFDGTSDYIFGGNSVGDDDFEEMTIEAWIKRTSSSTAWRTALHRNDGTTVGSSVFFIGLQSGGHNIAATIGAGSYTGAGSGYLAGATTVSSVIDTWYYVVCSWDGTTGRTYVNGEEEKTYPLSAAEFSNKHAYTRIGSSGNSTGYLFPGEIDEVKIWNRSLSAEEISASYNSSSLKYLNHNFTSLVNHNYSYYAHAINTDGEESTTATQYINVSVDLDDPISSVDGITPYTQTSSPLTITATASDATSGVNKVVLYHRHSSDNTTWVGIMDNHWNVNWTRRKLITVDDTQISNTLHNFPVLVALSSDDQLSSNAQTDGDDITFIDFADNTTQYNHEIEYFNSDTGELYAWVNITNLNNDTKFWMYYGNPTCISQQNVSGTWNSQYTQVLHLNETDIDNGVGDIKDSTGNINASTVNMDTSDHITALVGGGMTFDGSNDYIDTAYTDSISSGSYTLNIWVKDIPTGNRYVVCQHDASYSSDFILGYTNGGFWGDSATRAGGSTISDGSWHQLGFTMTTGSPCTSYLYIDGIQIGDSIAGPVPPALGQSVKIMARGDGAGSYVSGLTDEFRISNTIRNASWIATEFATINNQNTFITLGDEEGSGWMIYGEDTTSPYSYSFNFPNGTGYYQFFSKAYDNKENIEMSPSIADTICRYETSLTWDNTQLIAWRIVNTTGKTIFNLSTSGDISISGTLSESSSKPANVAYAFNNSFWITTSGDLHITGTITTVVSPIWKIRISGTDKFKFYNGNLEISGTLFENI